MLAKRSVLIGTVVFEQTAPASLRDGIPALLRRGIIGPIPQLLFWLRFAALCFLWFRLSVLSFQFSVGVFRTLSTTNTSSGALRATSFTPSFSILSKSEVGVGDPSISLRT